MGDVIKAVILGIVEGVTEFLPVSSTGHLVLAQRWMGIDLEKDPFWGMFAVFIQLGAIMSVVVYFREKLMLLLLGPRALRKEPAQIPAEADARPHLTDGPPAGGMTETERRRTLLMIAIATAPLVLAYFANEWSEKNMNSPAVVAWALAIGGVLMIAIELLVRKPRTQTIEQTSAGQAITVGLAQIVAAVFPGTSRSAATILGGMLAGMSRSAAAEMSFFLAIPAMAAASGYKLLKFMQSSQSGLSLHQGIVLAVGTIVSFVVAWLVIALFMSYIRRHSFMPFAIYRIALGILVFLVMR